MNREEILCATLHRWRQTDFVWERADCMMSVFDYAREITGRDAGAEWRGTYHDEPSAIAVLAAAGGGFAGMRRGFASIDVPLVERALRGDPVCVRIGGHEIGGLFLGEMTALRMAHAGVLEVRVPHVGVWRL